MSNVTARLVLEDGDRWEIEGAPADVVRGGLSVNAALAQMGRAGSVKGYKRAAALGLRDGAA
ncbi:MAG TPA: hypothetical protein VEC14_02750 [Reyranellaceae bacterium]|nr:hypothetical protein [Reyranellaceae bacterium]